MKNETNVMRVLFTKNGILVETNNHEEPARVFTAEELINQLNAHNSMRSII